MEPFHVGMKIIRRQLAGFNKILKDESNISTSSKDASKIFAFKVLAFFYKRYQFMISIKIIIICHDEFENWNAFACYFNALF